MKQFLDKIEYKPAYYFECRANSMYDDGRAELRVCTVAPCTTTGFLKQQAGRWFVVEDPFDEADVVRTAYQAMYLFELHEMQEHFRYNGKTVFDPHLMNI